MRALLPAFAVALVLGAALPASAQSIPAGAFRDGLTAMQKDAAVAASRSQGEVSATFDVVRRTWTVSVAPFSGGGNGS